MTPANEGEWVASICRTYGEDSENNATFSPNSTIASLGFILDRMKTTLGTF